MRGDLDWIVMMALEKDRSRRYETANGFAKDIERYLSDQPVLARPPTTAYKLRKFLKKHRSSVIAAGTILSLLVFGLAGTLAGWREAKSQTQLARDAESATKKKVLELEKLTEFQASQLAEINVVDMGFRLRQKLIDDVRESLAGRELTIEQQEKELTSFSTALDQVDFVETSSDLLKNSIFAPTIESINAKYADQPLFVAKMLSTVGSTAQKLGLLQVANEPTEVALSIRRNELGNEHPETLSATSSLASLRRAQGKFAEAESLIRKVLQTQRRLLGSEHPDTLMSITNFAIVLQAQNEFVKAIPLFNEAVETSRRSLGSDHPQTLHSIDCMGVALMSQGQASGLDLLKEALEGRRRTLGNNHPDTVASMVNVAVKFQSIGKAVDAEQLLLEAIAVQRVSLGSSHPHTLTSIHNLAITLLSVNRIREAESFFLEAFEGRRGMLGPNHPDTVSSLRGLTSLRNARMGLGFTDDQLSTMNYRSLEELRLRPSATTSATHEACAAADDLLSNARILLRKGSNEEAEEIVRAAIAGLATAEISDWRMDRARSMLGECLAGQSLFGEAEPLFVSGYHGLASREQEIPIDARAAVLDEAKQALQKMSESTEYVGAVIKFNKS